VYKPLSLLLMSQSAMTRRPPPSPLRPTMPIAARRLHPAGFVPPCLPTLAREVPDGPQWAHEIKHDGYGMICRRDGDRVSHSLPICN
jgi:ATP-dependent DNA ligase